MSKERIGGRVGHVASENRFKVRQGKRFAETKISPGRLKFRAARAIHALVTFAPINHIK
jgi:hypothetical protein